MATINETKDAVKRLGLQMLGGTEYCKERREKSQDKSVHICKSCESQLGCMISAYDAFIDNVREADRAFATIVQVIVERPDYLIQGLTDILTIIKERTESYPPLVSQLYKEDV